MGGAMDVCILFQTHAQFIKLPFFSTLSKQTVNDRYRVRQEEECYKAA